MSALLDRLQADFGVTDITVRDGRLTTFKAPRHYAETLIRELRDREGFTHLNFMTCIDYMENGVFSLVYMLTNHDRHTMFGIHVDIDRDNAEMDSIHTLWAQAWAFQRELREMYGVRFPGSPRLDEDFCLEGWDDIPPLRRDFDTAKYSTEHFGHRERSTEEPRQYMKVQFYPNRGGDAE